MKNKILTLGITGLLLGGLLFVAPGSALAYRGDVNVKGPNHTEEREAVMTKLFDTKNFSGWVKEMTGKGVSRIINTQDKFNKFVEARKLALQGKTTEANKIRTELGLGLKNGSGNGLNGVGNRMGNNK